MCAAQHAHMNIAYNPLLPPSQPIRFTQAEMTFYVICMPVHTSDTRGLKTLLDVAAFNTLPLRENAQTRRHASALCMHALILYKYKCVWPHVSGNACLSQATSLAAADVAPMCAV